MALAEPDATITLRIDATGRRYLVASGAEGHYVRIRHEDNTESDEVMYPPSDWVSAAQYVIACVKRDFEELGVYATSPRCGECGVPMSRPKGGSWACPVHGGV